MKRAKTKYFLVVFFLFLGMGLEAQEFNYWVNGIGSRSNMLAGAVTAGVRDNSAIFYNPAGLAFTENSSLSVSSNGYYLGVLNGENSVGTKLNLESTSVDALPQIVSFIQKVPKLPISVTLAAINRGYSNIKTSYRHKMYYDVLPDNEGDEIYIGSYGYNNRIKEDWVGFGYGKEILPGFGVGISTFATYRNQNYYLNESADVYSSDLDTLSLTSLSNTSFSDNLEFNAFGIVFVVGTTYSINKVKLGLNITMPRINLGFVSSSNLKRRVYSYIPYLDNEIYNASLWQLGIKSQYHSPVSVDLGVDFPFRKDGVVYAKVSYFGRVKKYGILKKELDFSNEFDGTVPPDLNNYVNMFLANKPVLNIAIAVQQHILDRFEAMVGFRTDFNYLDTENLDVYEDFIPGQMDLDLYHFSGGVIWKTEKYDLSIGGSFSFGSNKNSLQQINLTEPLIDNHLFGERQPIANPKYRQVSVLLGFTYFFSRI